MRKSLLNLAAIAASALASAGASAASVISGGPALNKTRTRRITAADIQARAKQLQQQDERTAFNSKVDTRQVRRRKSMGRS